MTISKTTLLGVSAIVSVLAFGVGYTVPDGSLGLIGAAEAQGPGSRTCSTRTLYGAYGIKFEGQKIGAGPYASVSRIVFDGIGTFTTNEIARFNGAPVERSFTGPYIVNDDCTGYLDFTSHLSNPPHEVHGNFVIVDAGREFFILDNEEGWASSGVGKRQ
jgi:hypothetical protein